MSLQEGTKYGIPPFGSRDAVGSKRRIFDREQGSEDMDSRKKVHNMPNMSTDSQNLLGGQIRLKGRGKLRGLNHSRDEISKHGDTHLNGSGVGQNRHFEKENGRRANGASPLGDWSGSLVQLEQQGSEVKSNAEVQCLMDDDGLDRNPWMKLLRLCSDEIKISNGTGFSAECKAWIKEQRGMYMNGRLDEEQERMFEEMLSLQNKSLPQCDWKSWFTSAKQCAHGLKSTGGKGLSDECKAWIVEQKSLYGKGFLTEGQENILGDLLVLKLEFQRRFQRRRWLETFQISAKMYRKKQEVGGSLPVDRAKWFSKQKGFREEGVLDEDQIDLLESLPNWEWRTKSLQGHNYQQWFKGYTEWVKRYENAESKRISGRFREWLSKQYGKLCEGKLSEKQKEDLEELPCWADFVEEMKQGGSSPGHRRSVEEHNYQQWFKGYTKWLKQYENAKNKKISRKFREWLSKQYGKLCEGKLSEKQKEDLEELPCWADFVEEREQKRLGEQKRSSGVVEPNEQQENLWEESVEVDGLQTFMHYMRKIKNSTCLPSECEAWLNEQMQLYSNGQLGEKLEHLLEDMLFLTKDVTVNFWRRWMADFKINSKIYNESKAKGKYLPADCNNWFLRQKYRYRNGTISIQQVQLVEGLKDWSWTIGGRNGAGMRMWLTSYFRYITALKQNKGVPGGLSRNNQAWFNEQKHRYRDGEHNKKQKELMEKIPGWKEGIAVMEDKSLCGASVKPEIKDTWNKAYERYRNLLRLGDGVIPPTNRKFISWVSQQRRLYRKKKLSQRQISMLENLPNWSWECGHYLKWLKKYDHYAKRLRQTGGVIPVSEILLQDWVRRQRVMYRENRLSQKQISKLNDLPEWRWSSYRDIRKFVQNKFTNEGAQQVREQTEEGHMRDTENGHNQRIILDSKAILSIAAEEA